jgi:hypothetical protein
MIVHNVAFGREGRVCEKKVAELLVGEMKSLHRESF